MDLRHEKLPGFGSTDPTKPKRSPREPDLKPEVDPIEIWGTQQPVPDRRISQWRLQKLIIEANGLGLSDFCWMYQIEDREDDRIWFGLNQLLRAGRIRVVMGTSRKTMQMGKFFMPTEKTELEHVDESGG